jgi:hypothetical protein
LAVAACASLGWKNALGNGWAEAAIVALFSASITLLGASSNGRCNRLLSGLLGSVLAWVALVAVASVMTLARFGRFEEGGPVGLAFVLGVYLGLPIAILTSTIVLLTRRGLGRPSTRRGEHG